MPPVGHHLPFPASRFWRRCARGCWIAGLALAAAVAYGDGEYQWQWSNGSSSSGATVYSSPAVDANGTVYYGVALNTIRNPGALWALTTTPDGKVAQKWTVQMPDRIDASPLLGPDGTLYIGCWNGFFYAYDSQTGVPKWIYDMTPPVGTDVASITSTAAMSRDGKTIYVGVGLIDSNYQLARGLVVAITTSRQVLWSTPINGFIDSSPAVAADGTIYIGSYDKKLYALNPADGSVKWTHPLDGQIFASPAIGPDGTVYIGTNANTFAAIAPDNTTRWQLPMSTPGSPVVGPDGTIYVANLFDANLYALNPADGSTKWMQPGSPATGSTPVVRADNTIIFGGNDMVLRAYDGNKNGQILWTSGTRITGRMGSCAVVSPTPDHSIIVGATDGSVYSFAGNAYGLSRYASWPMFQHDAAHSGQAPDIAMGGHLANIATRGLAGPNHALIAGFVVKGTGAGKNVGKKFLVRAVGPGLIPWLGAASMPDPGVTIHFNPSFNPASNDDWGLSDNVADIRDTSALVGAFPLAEGSKDAAVVATLGVSNTGTGTTSDYTATVDSPTGTSGIALVEVYDADPTNPSNRVVNLSSRGYVGAGDNIMIPGAVVRGGRIRLLVRAVGPGLVNFGVANVLQKPVLSVFSGSTQIASNTGWTTDGWKGDLITASGMVGAFQLAPNSTDSAMIIALDAGNYTFQVSGVGGTTGDAMVELYLLPF